MSSSVRALVIGHADFAAGIVSAVEQITGSGALLMPLSNSSLGASGIEEMVRGILVETGVRVIFTDLPAGSATMAVRRVQRGIPDLTVVAGANLAILLEFVQQASSGDGTRDRASAVHALDRGKAAMILYGATGVD